VRRVGLIPTLVTLANAYCGVLAIYKTHDGKFLEAGYLILFAMLFDVLDGLVARLARAQSTFGAYLDSLSDVISFGVAPAFLAKTVVEVNLPWTPDGPWGYHPKLLTALTIPFALLAVVRLARYNVEHASSEGSDEQGQGITTFAGIPTPGAAGIVASLVLLCYGERSSAIFRPLVGALPPLCFLLGAAMVSRIPYAHFGSRFLQGRREFSYLFVVVFMIVVAIRFPEECAVIGFVLYGLSGPVMMLRGRKPPGPGEEEPAPGDVDIPDIPEGV
jgi:CDP-diacylglycerol--serine O-phosphatidyltransferase